MPPPLQHQFSLGFGNTVLSQSFGPEPYGVGVVVSTTQRCCPVLGWMTHTLSKGVGPWRFLHRSHLDSFFNTLSVLETHLRPIKSRRHISGCSISIYKLKQWPRQAVHSVQQLQLVIGFVQNNKQNKHILQGLSPPLILQPQAQHQHILQGGRGAELSGRTAVPHGSRDPVPSA